MIHDPLLGGRRLVGTILSGFASPGTASAAWRVDTSTAAGGGVGGRECFDVRLRPWRWAVAVAVNWRASGSPVSARRGPRSAASAIRRAASGLVMQQPVGQRAAQRAAQFFLAGLGVELVDQRVPDRR